MAQAMADHVDAEEALRYSDKALELAPYLAQPALSRASALMALGHHAVAQQTLETALELNPGHPLLEDFASRLAGPLPHD